MAYGVRERERTEVQPQITGGCHHHWIIESAHGRSSHAICKICGAQREFLNAVPEEPMVRRRVAVAIPGLAEEAEPEEISAELEAEEEEEAAEEEAEAEEVPA